MASSNSPAFWAAFSLCEDLVGDQLVGLVHVLGGVGVEGVPGQGTDDAVTREAMRLLELDHVRECFRAELAVELVLAVTEGHPVELDLQRLHVRARVTPPEGAVALLGSGLLLLIRHRTQPLEGDRNGTVAGVPLELEHGRLECGRVRAAYTPRPLRPSRRRPIPSDRTAKCLKGLPHFRHGRILPDPSCSRTTLIRQLQGRSSDLRRAAGQTTSPAS